MPNLQTSDWSWWDRQHKKKKVLPAFSCRDCGGGFKTAREFSDHKCGEKPKHPSKDVN